MLPERNFVYLPASDPATGELVVLGKSTPDYRPDSFVAIRYSEPRLQPPVPLFYPVVERSPYTFPIQPDPSPVEIMPGVSRGQYLDHVKTLKAHIRRGDIYEINYCIPFTAQTTIDPFSVFARLCMYSDVPYRMLARLGDTFVLCVSPELFLKKQGDTLYTKPIKGTIRRGETPADDLQLKETLFNSHKDRTENVMAVDVARNDLSMVAARGSVTVNRLYGIESFKTVHQMVSTVSCTLRPGTSFDDIIHATFPMASMTGAPKRRAMELIGEHEAFARKYYSGTMGFIHPSGDFELPVLIRSLFYNPAEKNRVWFAAGGAITHLSDPEQEYEECLLKAGTMLRALNARVP